MVRTIRVEHLSNELHFGTLVWVILSKLHG